jgi:hypothetical protein
VEALNLLAKMDIRAPRANRGAGFKSQGCYRPDAVSARPMGHLVASLAQHLVEGVFVVFEFTYLRSRVRRGEPAAAEQAAHSQQRPAQAAIA